MKLIYYLLITITLITSCENKVEIEPQNINDEPNITLGLNFPTTENGRVSYSIDHASITLRDANNPEQIETFQSLEKTDNSIEFSLPECRQFKLVELNVYNLKNQLILIQDNNSIGQIIWYCKPNGGLGSGGPNPPDDGDDTDVDVTEPIKSVWFDWETATYVSNNTSLPTLPWVSSASTGVSREIALDHLQEDGWVLMHNSFTLESGANDTKRYLLFYNKFTGVLRMWYWHEGSNASTQLKYSIQYLEHTGLLNFNSEFASPMDEKNPQYSEFLSGSKTIPSGQGLSQNTWYMFDYEIAYDNNVINITKEKSDMILGTRGMEISDIDISGTQEGEINGNIILNSPTSLFNIPSISIKNSNNDNSDQTNVSFTGDSNDSNWWSSLNSAIKNGITKSVGNATGSLSTSVLNLVTNPVGNFLNSLIHRGKSNGSSVQLKLATKIQLDGTISTQTPVSSINLHIPGSQNNSLEYLYDGTLGVFNLDQRPQLKYQQTWYHIGTSNPRYFQYYKLDRNSFNFVVNPDILIGVSILETKSELFFYKDYTGGVRLDGLVGLGGVNMPSGNELVFGVHSGDLDYEYYKVKESSVKPIAPVGSASYGFMWNQIPSSNYFGSKLDPDKRFVVKTTLRLKINNTGREVTIIKSYLPEYVDDQSTINLEY